MMVKRLLIVLPALLLICDTAHSRTKHPIPPEQTEFAAENSGLDRPVEIPSDVMTILGNDEMVRNELRNESLPADQLPSEWFLASAIHLSTPGERDLIVVAKKPIVEGNSVSFWVFRLAAQDHQLVLTARGRDLIVKKTRWKGYRNIELSVGTVTQITSILFRWDGAKYSEYREQAVKIP
ncbi:MAG: hypothetical protein WAN35_08405 [Terracidiphilus sp.]